MFKENWASRNIPSESSSGRGRSLAPFKRITWGAIFAGVVVALVIQMVLSLLGLGIGLGAVNPTDANPLAGIGIGAGIWWVASMLISLFIGGLVAGRLSGIPGKADSFLHGMLTWCVFTLLSFYLLTTTVGGIFNTVGKAVSQSMNVAGNVAGPEAADKASDAAAQAKDKFQQQKENVQQQMNDPAARQKAEDASSKASMAGIFGAIGLILGGIVASIGGMAGRHKPKAEVRVPVKERVYKE